MTCGRQPRPNAIAQGQNLGMRQDFAERITSANGRTKAGIEAGTFVEKGHQHLTDAPPSDGVPRDAGDRIDDVAQAADLMILMHGGLAP